jgi:hypothetical protein
LQVHVDPEHAQSPEHVSSEVSLLPLHATGATRMSVAAVAASPARLDTKSLRMCSLFRPTKNPRKPWYRCARRNDQEVARTPNFGGSDVHGRCGKCAGHIRGRACARVSTSRVKSSARHGEARAPSPSSRARLR